MKIELRWSEDYPNHMAAKRMWAQVLSDFGVRDPIERLEIPDAETGKEVRFPGSPTIRIEGIDVEPSWESCDDYTPRCLLYATIDGLRCVFEREWVVRAARRSVGS